MLKIEKEILPDHQAKLTVTLEPERVQKELKAAAERISRQVNIPGFRRGKAPYHIVLRYFGEDAIFEEALDPLGQSVYKEALQESGLEPYAAGTLHDFSHEPFVMSFTIPLAPEVKLGSYRDMRIPFKVEKVTDKDVEHALEHLQDEQATLEPVERPVQWDDVATLDILGSLVKKAEKSSKTKQVEVEGRENANEVFIDRKAVAVLIAKKATYPVPGFPEKIVGISAGEQRSFDITLSKSKDVDEDLRGQTIHFEVKCKEAHERDVPALDDDFARSAGDYESLADLRAKLRKELGEAAERNARTEYADKALDHLIESVVEVKYPPVMLEDQIDDMVEDFEKQLRRQGLNVDDYLKLNNLSKESLRDDFRETARMQIMRGLVLGELSIAEKLTVGDEEVEDEIKKRSLTFGEQASKAQQLFSSSEMRNVIASRLLSDKAMDRLIQIARGEAPSLAEGEEAEAASESGKRSRKKPAAPAKKAPRASKEAAKPSIEVISDEVSTESLPE